MHSTRCPVYFGVGSILNSAGSLPWFTTPTGLTSEQSSLSDNTAQSLMVECVQTCMEVSLFLNLF